MGVCIICYQRGRGRSGVGSRRVDIALTENLQSRDQSVHPYWPLWLRRQLLAATASADPSVIVQCALIAFYVCVPMLFRMHVVHRQCVYMYAIAFSAKERFPSQRICPYD